MRTLRSIDAVRAAISAALGVSTLACGGVALLGPSDDAGGPTDTTADAATTDAATTDARATDATAPDGGVGHFGCTSPTPIVIDGKDTGYDLCEGGNRRRRAVVDCPNLLPRASYTCTSYGGFDGGCATDNDCAATPNASCSNPFGAPTCTCLAGCVRDSDCQSGQICVCGEPTGTCETAACNAGGCGTGHDCAEYGVSPVGCSGNAFACETASDRCFSDSDCASVSGSCTLDPTTHARVCEGGRCSIGRPFLVADRARLAPVTTRSDWAASPDALRPVPAATRALLADAWLAIARMEHASVGAFARFALQLLALGAPPHLVTGAQQAMADETEHARIAFGLASAYAGKPLGPGPLAIDACLDATSLLEVLDMVFEEGCVGETVAAIEAREAREHATDPVVCGVLAKIAADETRHAQLAWRTVAWALDAGGPEVREWLRAKVATASMRAGTGVGAGGTELLPHGIVGAPMREHLRRTAMAQLIVPCVISLAA
jgi:hypothetical protein